MPEQGIGDDVERDQQAVVALYHRCPGGAAIGLVDRRADLGGRTDRG